MNNEWTMNKMIDKFWKVIELLYKYTIKRAPTTNNTVESE